MRASLTSLDSKNEKRNKTFFFFIFILLLRAWEKKPTDAGGFITDGKLVFRLLMLEQNRLACSSEGVQTKQLMFNTACSY